MSDAVHIVLDDTAMTAGGQGNVLASRLIHRAHAEASWFLYAPACALVEADRTRPGTAEHLASLPGITVLGLDLAAALALARQETWGAAGTWPSPPPNVPTGRSSPPPRRPGGRASPYASWTSPPEPSPLSAPRARHRRSPARPAHRLFGLCESAGRTGGPYPRGVPVPDTWNGRLLADASPVREQEPIHYRVHDADSGRLLGFGTARGGDYVAVADHYRRIQNANSGRSLVLRRYDRPAGDEFSRTEGPEA